ncbi:hypothetical protein [Listeria booriae]|uniref:hypothetical protein n=1 Tax=Listeria booriae TaxID=1552123 RepID=UPI0016280692|nr:hypothetical protein [Listeria booriae]
MPKMTYKIGYDIVVNDDNCNDIGKGFTDIAIKFEDKLKNYLDSLTRVLDGAVKSGEVASNLEAFKLEAKTLENVLEGIHQEITSTLETFVADIDTVDNDLY